MLYLKHTISIVYEMRHLNFEDVVSRARNTPLTHRYTWLTLLMVVS